MGGDAGAGDLCPACDRKAMVAEREAVALGMDGGRGSAADRRFVSLSALPEDQRIPTKRGLPVGRSLREHVVTAMPPAPPPQVPPPAPAPIPAPELRQMGFNCPSCFMILIIREPAAYDGRAAPCPCCGAVIMPPRVAPASPFSIVMRAAGPVPALPGFPGIA